MNRFFQNKLDLVLFWALTVFFHAYTRLALISEAGVGQFLLEVILRNVLLAAAIYIVIRFVIPKLASGKKILQALLILLGVIVCYVLLKDVHDQYLYGSVIGDSERSFFSNSLYNFSIVLFYLAFASALHLSKEWYLQQELIRKMEVEKLSTELEYLRAQINPHFLFNSINTIYFQIDKQNNTARETLNKFSDMLRYQLYECNADKIDIEKEVKYLDSYVNLQRLRRGANYSINFDCSENLNHFSIPPLLLIPFVENAFKHVSNFAERSNTINIHLSKEESEFKFVVVNSMDVTAPCSESGGIGLKNVKRRLELLYGDVYSLNIQKTSETFSVTLELPIV